MQTVLLVIHLMVVAALVGVVLLQRSEGGALGIGGGGGFMTSRGTANVLTRTTAILAALFFLTSIGLSLLPRLTGSHDSILDRVQTTPTAPAADQPIGSGKGGVLDQLNQMSKPAAQPGNTPVAPAVEVPAAPATQAPATETPAAPATEAPATPTTDSAPAAPAAPAPTP
ncbi:preprotein translocase subunit SecG [Pleomorphomonas carboxyditropha]|uniref:Protein-export membrane protein SecG n=1 Tax=Pleomorphomonas carboxyditropha TaxID=2023338 RepID=A0A2G9X2E3_9HYPH|nr:preprotein translocase subunit SecG [Pleomorphomonas carboxyditropha]PIP01084.1 preprotein translocase subunit SecG [Pleomorphomonas carboxyditropha]